MLRYDKKSKGFSWFVIRKSARWIRIGIYHQQRLWIDFIEHQTWRPGFHLICGAWLWCQAHELCHTEASRKLAGQFGIPKPSKAFSRTKNSLKNCWTQSSPQSGFRTGIHQRFDKLPGFGTWWLQGCGEHAWNAAWIRFWSLCGERTPPGLGPYIWLLRFFFNFLGTPEPLVSFWRFWVCKEIPVYHIPVYLMIRIIDPFSSSLTSLWPYFGHPFIPWFCSESTNDDAWHASIEILQRAETQWGFVNGPESP